MLASDGHKYRNQKARQTYTNIAVPVIFREKLQAALGGIRTHDLLCSRQVLY